jgi:hypothetical protein
MGHELAGDTSPVQPSPSAGRHDAAVRRQLKRSGRERGGWAYITAEQLERAGYGSDDPAPFYRIWGGQRGRYVVVLYREP